MRIIFLVLALNIFAITIYAQQNIAIAEKIIYKVDIVDSNNPEGSNIYSNIEETQRVFYIKSLIEAVQSGKMKAYSDDNFQFELSLTEIENIMTVRDTAYMNNPENPSEEIMVAVEEEIGLEEITALNFIEKWTFDKTTLQTKKQVMAVAPLLQLMVDSEDGGEIMGHKILFWIKL